MLTDTEVDQRSDPPFHVREMGALLLELAAEKAQIEHRYEQRLATERRLRAVASGLHRVLEVDAVLSFGAAELGTALAGRVVVRRISGSGDDAIVAQWFDDGVPPIREVDGAALPESLRHLAVVLADRLETVAIGDLAVDDLADAARHLDDDARRSFDHDGARAVLLTATRVADDDVMLFELHRSPGPDTGARVRSPCSKA